VNEKQDDCLVVWFDWKREKRKEKIIIYLIIDITTLLQYYIFYNLIIDITNLVQYYIFCQKYYIICYDNKWLSTIKIKNDKINGKIGMAELWCLPYVNIGCEVVH